MSGKDIWFQPSRKLSAKETLEIWGPSPSAPPPQQQDDWRKRRMVNMPHPHETGMRVVGFVVPTDETVPFGLVSEAIGKILNQQQDDCVRVPEKTLRLAITELAQCRSFDMSPAAQALSALLAAAKEQKCHD